MGESGDRVVTEHLLLRPPTAADAEAYLRLFLHPKIEEWLRPEPLTPFTTVEIREMLDGDVRHWAEFDFGPWVLLDRESGSYLGRAGLRHTEVEGDPAIELAWTVDPARQGKGLATEAATAALDLARALKLPEVVALVLPRNRPSCRVAEKVGMPREGKVPHAGLDHALYRLTLA